MIGKRGYAKETHHTARLTPESEKRWQHHNKEKGLGMGWGATEHKVTLLSKKSPEICRLFSWETIYILCK